MTRFVSRLDPHSAEYLENRAAMLAALDEVDAVEAEMLRGGERYVDRHRKRGKLLARERIELLVDRGSPLLELSPLAGYQTDHPLGSGMVTAIGVVSGIPCVITANDPLIRGGSKNPVTIAKTTRAMEIARVNRLPVISLTESAGADLPYQAEIFMIGGAYFKQLSQLSKAGVPTVAVVLGPSTAGGAYVPGMSDYSILVQNQARVYLGGPALVKMATSEEADEEELGGAEMHARVSGVADYLARDEADALRTCRRIVANFPRPPVRPGTGPEPCYDPEELLGIPSADPRRPYDIKEIVARVADGSEIDEFKPLYGTNLLCAWIRMHGRIVGVIGNNGILFSAESQKGAHFIQLCNEIRTPILFFQNITGFMVGTRYEHGGIIKDGAKMINAVSNSSVPHVTLMVGASFGAGNFAMSGRPYDPRFIFTWPSHRIGVMGGKQLAGVLSIVRQNAARSSGREVDEEAEEAYRQQITHQVDRESTALYATGHLWDDGIIDPRDTRVVLGMALAATDGHPQTSEPGFATFRM
jgi:acyl-CoA carboxylase subunit beta